MTNIVQDSTYYTAISSIDKPIYPQVILSDIDSKSLNFLSYSAFYDEKNKYLEVMRDNKSLPLWIFNIRIGGKILNELSHHSMHNGVICNDMSKDGGILFHLKTGGLITNNILFKAKYLTYDTKYNGIASYVNIDKSYIDSDVKDFNMVIWLFPHPKNNKLIILIVNGYIQSTYPINWFKNSIRWHINNILQNFKERISS